jgi:tetratricopeptide (TPR) repeat protein
MWNLFQLARVYMFAVNEADRANASMAEAQALLEALGPDYYVPEEGLRVRAHFANQRAAMANAQGRYMDAKTHASESIRLYEMSGSRWFASMGHDNFADACLALGANEEAREHLLAALNLISNVEGWTTAYLLWSLAKVDVRLGELERALEYCRDSIREADQIPELGVVASVMGLMAAIRATQSQPAQAARLVGASTAMWVRQQRSPWENTSLDKLLPGWRDGPQAAAIQQAYDAGLAMTADEAAAYALAEDAA